MRQHLRNLVTNLVCGVALASNVFGQSVGDKVVVIAEEAELKQEATVADTVNRGAYLKVREVSGNWLWVDAYGTRGWVSRDKVILASQAIEHFTEELRRNPKDV